jgi:hypothetical protein
MSGVKHDRRLESLLRQALARAELLSTSDACRLAYGQPPHPKGRYGNIRRALADIAVVIGRDDNSHPGRPLIWARKGSLMTVDRTT